MRSYTYAPYPSPWGYLKTIYNGETVEIGALSALDQIARSQPGRVEALGERGVDVASEDRLIRITACRLEGEEVAPSSLFDLDGQFTCPGVRSEEHTSELQ